MRRFKVTKIPTGMPPDWPAGEPFPPPHPSVKNVDDPHYDEYIIYEVGDELPRSLLPIQMLRRELPDETILWRYIDFPKLYSLLTKKSLYFTPGYVLRSLEPYELRLPVQLSVKNRDTSSSQDASSANFIKNLQLLEDMQEGTWLYSLGISCWHMNKTENNALWQIYVPNGGVAIKTTLGRLKKAFGSGREKRLLIYADIVEYIDYRSEAFKQHPSASGFEQIFHKAKFYEYEKELRLAYNYEESLSIDLAEDFKKNAPQEVVDKTVSYLLAKRENFLRVGPFVPVDLSTLIEEIVVGPRLGTWYYDLVCELISNAIEVKIPIRFSMVDKWGRD